MKDGIKLSPEHGLNPTIPMCFWCGGDKEEVALMGKIDKQDSQAPRRVIINYEPCAKCKEIFEKGIHVMGVVDQPMAPGQFPIIEDENVTLYPTGSMIVATAEWTERFLTENDKADMVEHVLSSKALMLPDDFVVSLVKELKDAEELEVQVPDEVKGEPTDEDN